MKKSLLFSCLFFLVTHAAIAQSVSPGTYTLTNKNSNLCLAIRGATQNVGEEATQWTCDGNSDKHWKIIAAENNYFKIQNQNSGMFLAVGAGSRDYGGRCIQWLDEGQQDIYWRFVDAGAGFYKIQNKNSGLFLAVGAGSRNGGADLIQWGDEGQADLMWRLDMILTGLAVLSNQFLYQFPATATTIGRTNSSSPPRYGNANRREENGMACTSRRVDFTESNFERIITGGIWDKIYPGAIYNAQSVADGGFTTVNLPRNPMTMAVNLLSAASGPLSRRLPADGINRSSVWQEISNLLRSNQNVTNAARASFEMKQIHSAEQLRVFVGGDFSGWGASVQATFNSESRQSRNVYLVKVTQVYFDVVVDDNQQLISSLPNEEAVYVHSVSYGKIGYLRVESSESEQTIAAALNARYNWGTGNAGVQLNVNHNRVLQESQTVGFVVGGAPRVISGPQEMAEFVRDVQWNPNVAIVPIAYKLKFLRDRSDAYVSMTTSYTEKICEPIRRGTTLKVVTNSGSDDLRSYNTAFISVNFNDGTATEEKLLHRGLGQNQPATQVIDFGREIDLVNVRSISLRVDGTPNNNPFNGGDAGHTYDNWDLIKLQVSLQTYTGKEESIYNHLLHTPAAEGDKVPIRFTGDKRTAEFRRQL